MLRHGLLRGSFVPDRSQRELRELVRYRRSMIRNRATEVNRLQKVLEGANIKLSSVISDVTGVSGTAILQVIVEGVADPTRLARLGNSRLKASREELAEALEGVVGTHQRMLLGVIIRHIEYLDSEVAVLDKEVEKRMCPVAEEVKAIDAIPGVGRRTAEEILSETGTDMSRFPSADHITSWAKICPGSNESAGKQKSGRTGKGNPWLRAALVGAAWAAVRTKGAYYAQRYRQLSARRGKKRAVFAIARSILVAIYHILKRGTPYHELGEDYLLNLNRDHLMHAAIRRLEKLGYQVQVSETTPAAT